MFLLAPTMQALLLALSAGPAWAAGPAFGAGWFAEKRATQAQTAATGRLPGGGLAGIPSTLRDQQRANEQLQRSLANLGRGAAAIAAQQAAQAAARQAAMNQVSQVPDGLAEGGLKVDANPLTAGWTNARALTAASQARVNGRTVVTVEQTADKAILNWETFNVGRNTTVSFQQQSTWSVLNRVNDPWAKPSQIQGQIDAPGTVMLVNRNGVVFSGSSQVNVRNLVAAAVGMSDDQFRKGLYSDRTGTGAAERFTPSFGNDLVGLGDAARAGNATGDVRVEAGARIQTAAPGSVTQGGGYVLLLGREAHNAGQISTPGGQTALAAGDSFIIRRGLASDANTLSTTRGNEVSARRNAGSQAGLAVNTGLIQSPVGDITLTGHDVRQSGVAVSSTSVTARGTIHLLNSASDTTGSILLGQGSTTAILLQDDGTTALDAQRDAAARPPADGLADNYRQAGQAFDHLSALPDRRDQSRIEVTSGGTVQVQDGAMALATGGQVSMSAARRTQLDDGAILDVAGAVGVKVSMESNNLKVNIQGNELRDAPVNREGKTLNNDNVWIDRRTLLRISEGVNGYEKERWYTAGGLLEVGGYLGTSGHGIGEWAAIGGTVTVEGGELVTRKGSLINISGGTLDVASGYINQSWLRGEDGRLYEVSRAPGDLLYKGLYRGFEETHARWGANATRYFYNSLLAPARRYEDGYTAGRDAGRLVIGTRSAVVEGSIVGEAFQGERQMQARQVVDTGVRQQTGYQQSQLARALAGQLVVGRYVANQLTTNGATAWGYDLAAAARQIAFTDADAPLADTLALGDALPAARRDTVWLDATALSGLGLGQITAVASDTVSVRRGLAVATGGAIELYGPHVDIQADLTARGGRLAAGNVLQGVVRDIVLAPAANVSASVMVASGATLDTRGLWVNLLRDPAAADVAAYRNGGLIELRGTGVVAVAAGAVLDAGSGATRRIDGKLTGGRGGDITLEMARPDGSTPGSGQTGVVLDGEVRGYGVQGGGTLRLSSGQILIDDRADASTPPGGLLLRSDLFASGFSRYDLNGDSGMTVADGTILRVTMPVYRSKSAGPDPAAATLADALERWTPPLFQEDPRTARMSQRLGASLSLSAFARADIRPEGTLRIGEGAVVEVDPGQTLRLQSRGQMTLQGTLRAPGGQIVVARGADPSADVQAGGLPNSVWLDGQARLDVAGIAVTAVDMRGRRYGLQRDGGRIAIDGEFLVIRPGAVLDASGTSMVVDVAQDDGAGAGPRLVGGNGGEISLSAMAGLYLDGLMRAAAGAPGAAGGKLALTLDTPLYGAGTPDSMVRPRELTVAQVGGPSALPGEAAPGNAALTYGYGRIGVDQITAGAFDDVSLFARDLLTFDGDVTLAAGHAISLREGALGNTRAGATVRIAAPYVLLDGRSRHTPLVQQPVNATLNDWAPSIQAAAALLRVEADHIDIRNRVNTGMNGTALLNNGGRLAVDRRGYDNVTLYSRGDLRFLPAAQAADTRLGGISNASAFLTAGDLSLAAQRIYPATGSVGLAVAGWRGSGVYDNQRVLRIERVNGPLASSAPLSALGSLILNAPTVEQGGVLYAPLGNIRLGLQTDGQNQAVKLLAGSLTSVSAAGLTIPFGGTTDGLSYLYQGLPVEAVGVGGMAFQNLARGVSLAGGAVTVEAGAVIDLSGGGTLAGAAFVSGRGGSTDPLFHPLPRFDGATGRFDLPSLGDRPVYAILPGLPDAYAPAAPRDSAAGYAGSLPRAGETITLGADIPGLPAGTYTLLPAYYALLPGAFRVELGQGALAGNAQSLRGGSWSVSAIRGLSHTGTLDAMPRQALVTPGDVLRRHAQYNEMDYRAFVLADAARRGQPRPMLPADAAALELYYRDPPAAAAGPALRFEGLARFDRGEGGYGGQLVVRSNGGAVEIVNAGPSAGFSGISLRDGDLNAIGASRISIGGWTYQPVRGDDLRLATRTLGGSDVYLRSGATLRAPEVMLIAPDARSILIEQGGIVNTLGTGSAPYDSRLGYQYSGTGGNNLLVVSNGWLDFPAGSGAASGRIELAACPSGGCSGTAQLYSDGTIAFGANNLVLHDALRYGTRNLVVGASSLNAGSDAGLADAVARGVLPGGLRLSQALLRRLLDGDTSVGAPALERVIFSLRDSINFFGSVSLSTLDAATGKSSLAQLVLNTPALYGYGTAADVALLSTDTLVWNGVANGQPGEIADGGAGTGLGTLNLRARRIVLGDANGTPQVPHEVMARQAVGFGSVILDAAERITTGGEGSLEIYRSRGSFVDGKFQYEGGDLLMRTPMLTGAAGSVARITAGGALRLAATGNAAADADAPWGATLTLQGDRVDLDGVITLPSGKLTVQSERALTLGENSRLDLAGRAVALRDQVRYGWGGDVELESRKDNILQASGAIVDLSARYNQGGRLTAVALDPAAGLIDLRGTFRGQASGDYDAGGTLVPFDAAGVALRAQVIADFTDLNHRLNQGGVTGSRAFQLKRGDLVVGDEIKARHVNIAVDNGSLIVNGVIDASGAQVGSIRLAALNDLVINGLLDAHGTLLRVDSRGAIIDSPNRAVVELTSTLGRLRLDAGAAFDLRAGTAVANGAGPGLNDGRARGTLDLNARRVNLDDVALDIVGTPAILGAERVYVNAFRRYDDAPLATAPDITGRTPQVITQDYLDLIDRDSVAYMNASLVNAALRARLGGFRLRPGVEIVSATADGDLTVSGDLDLSAYRYGPGADRLDPARRGFGEAGLLLVRAKGDLNIYGSITDGFTPPLGTDDDSRAWRLVGRAGMDNSSGKDLWGQSLILPRAVTLRGGPGGTVFPTTDRESLNFDLPIAANTIKPNVRLPVQVELADTLTLGAGTVLAAEVMAADGTRYAKGSVLQQALTLAPGSRLGAGLALGQAISVRALTLPKGTPLSIFGAPLALSADLPLAAGAYLPAGTDLQFRDISVDLRDLDANGIQGKIWAVAPMLPSGTTSWSLRLAGGADLDSSDTRALRPLSQQGGRGNLTVADLHYMQDLSYGLLGESPIFSVIRTGRGDLDLLAGGSFQQGSYYGIYTAGTPSDSVRDAQGNPVRDALGRDAYNLPRAYDDLITQIEGYGSVLGSAGAAYEPLVTGDQYAAWYPEGGGNLLMTVQGDMSGAIRGMPARPAEFDPRGAALVPGSYPANWLWRQGGAGLGQQTAWWINFGTYVPSPFFSTFYAGGASVQGFMGIGTLGGGNLSVNVGGDAGVLKPPLMTDSAVYPTGQGLVLAVASTGRVTPDGKLVSTGGGDLELRVGGALNPLKTNSSSASGDIRGPSTDLNGVVTNLRGALALDARSIGRIDPLYNVADASDVRGLDPLRPTLAAPSGGLALVTGDSVARLDTLGDLALGGVGDAGRILQTTASPFILNGADQAGGAFSWYTLWTSRTAIDLFSAGGALTPISAPNVDGAAIRDTPQSTTNSYGNVYAYPSRFSAVAATGSIYFHPNAAEAGSEWVFAPGTSGRLEMLAGDGLYGAGYGVNASGAALATLATPERPAYTASWNGAQATAGNAISAEGALFAFGRDNAGGRPPTEGAGTTRFYAGGDIVGLRTGAVLAFGSGTEYRAARTVSVQAGRDIVNLRGLFLNQAGNDISQVYAGRDILHANVDIAGPGWLEVSAGRNLTQEDKGRLTSLGMIDGRQTTGKGGAGIVASAGGQGDYAAFARRYLDPANRADPGQPLAGQPGKTVKTYEGELLDWLRTQHGYGGAADQARAYFDALPAEQQRVFLRQVYYAELTAGGREYNDPSGPRAGSYARGRQAIAELYPATGADGQPLHYQGDITLFGGSGIQTLYGGSIHLMAPGGQMVFGVEGVAPPSTAGIITQGAGDIQMYAKGSILLGQSRVMTTFGGNILGWSAEGDINSGRGSKSTVVYTPQRRLYDDVGNVTLSPTVPSTGAGIATLDPIPEVPPGDVDLVAPLGTIDAGEAGIRFSGNVNLAALQVVNAANVVGQGKATGVPALAAVNVAALTSASAAAAGATQGAQETTRQQQAAARRNLPSIISVQILGYGSEPVSGAGAPGASTPAGGNPPAGATATQGYDPRSIFQMVGNGELDAAQKARLTDPEQRGLSGG